MIDDLTLAGRVLQPQRLLDRIRVEGVQRALAGPVEPLRAWIDALVRRGVRHLFHADGDLHRADSTMSRCAAPGNVTEAISPFAHHCLRSPR